MIYYYISKTSNFIFNLLFNLTLLCFIPSISFAYSNYLQVGPVDKQQTILQLQTYLKTRNDYPSVVKESNQKKKIGYELIIEGFKTQQSARQLQLVLEGLGYHVTLKPLSKQQKLFSMMPYPAIEEAKTLMSHKGLVQAKKKPEVLLTHNLEMTTSPDFKQKKIIELSMKEAILLSLRYSPDLISAQLDRVIARYQLHLSENEFELQYALSGGSHSSWTKTLGIKQPFQDSSDASVRVSRKSSWGGTTTVTMNNTYDGTNYSPQVTLNFEQPLLRGAGPTVVESSLRNRYDQEFINKLSLKSSYIDKITSVISAYRSLIQQINSFETQKKSLKDAKYTFWVNKKRIEAGELEPAGNIQQEYQVASLSLTLESQKNQLEQAQRALLLLIGLDPTLNIHVPSDIKVSQMSEPNLDKTIRFALANNISYLSALVNYKIIKRAFVVAQNQQLWELNLSATQTYGSIAALGQDSGFNNITNGRNQASQVGLRLNVPVNDMSRKSSLIAAKISLEKARLSLLAQKRQLTSEVMNKVVNIRNQINLYNMHVKQLALANRSYSVEVKKRQAGISSSLDVTNTQNQLIDARNSLIGSKISYLEGKSSLEQLLGTTLDVWHIKMRFI